MWVGKNNNRVGAVRELQKANQGGANLLIHLTDWQKNRVNRPGKHNN